MLHRAHTFTPVLVPRLYGNGANPGTNLNPSQGGERAQAFINYVRSASQRTAGGTYIGSNEYVEFVKQVHNMNIDVAKQILKYTTTPGIIYTIHQEGAKTKQQIETRMATDPEFKQQVETVTQKVLTTGSDILSTVTNPITGISTTISWLPWIVGGLVVAAVVFAFKNPGNVKGPRKVSVF